MRQLLFCGTTIFALVAALGGCSRDPVDSKLVGSWQTAIASPAGAYQLRFTTLSNGQYRTDFQGPALVPPETGYFKAAGGKWRLEKLTGSNDEGTYEFVSADTVLLKSKTGALLWNRIPNDVPAATAPLAAASESVAPAGFASATPTAAGAAQPSADLLAAGPFGAPLVQTAAAMPAPAQTAFGAAAVAIAPADNGSAALAPSPFGTAAQSATSSGPFGTAIAAAPQPAPSIAGANGRPNLQSTAQSLGAASQQTLTSVQGTAQQLASQTAASANDAMDRATAEANKKVGQRIETFGSNAGSKIKNFFTGRKHRNDDDDADSTPAPQNGH